MCLLFRDQQAGFLLTGGESGAWDYRVCADGLVTSEWGVEAGQLSLVVTQWELVSLCPDRNGSQPL